MRQLDSIARNGAAYVPLLLRVTLGSLFIAHLYWKVAVYPGGLDRWWSNFATNGYPWFVPWYVFSAELAGALTWQEQTQERAGEATARLRELAPTD